MWHGVELVELEIVIRANIDISAFVLSAVAVLGSGKDWHQLVAEWKKQLIQRTCNALPIVLLLVTFHSHFVAADNSIKSVVLTEFLGDIRAKLHTHTSLTWPSTRLSLWVRPQHLHHQSCLAWLPLVVSVELSNIIQSDLVVRE